MLVIPFSDAEALLFLNEVTFQARPRAPIREIGCRLPRSRAPRARNMRAMPKDSRQLTWTERVDYKDKGHTVELIGKEDMEGTPVYKLKLTFKSGSVRTIYLDAENYLELRVTAKRKTPGGELEVDQYLGNYKAINGIVSAFSIETKVKGQTVNQVTIDKLEYDVAIDDAVFKMPAKSQETPKQTKAKSKPP